MVSKTRKANKVNSHSVKSLSVPELRRAFEHIDRFVDTKVMRLSEKEGVTAFRREWKKTFGQISEKAAKDYLHYMRSTGKKQKGGAVTVLSPAALGYDMRAGEGGPSVPPYVGGGLALPADSQMTASRGAEFPLPAAQTGSNAWKPQAGGKRGRKTRRQRGGALPSFGTALAEFVSRPFGMAAPPTPSQDAQMLMKGYNQFSSPRPEVNDLGLSQGRTVFNAAISPVSRMF
jgi:hypothetical protein